MSTIVQEFNTKFEIDFFLLPQRTCKLNYCTFKRSKNFFKVRIQ